MLLKKNKIDVISGKGRVLAAGKVEVSGGDGKAQVVEAKNIVIATGSDIARLKGIEIDEKRVVSSTGALALDKVPGKLLVVGAAERELVRQLGEAGLQVKPPRALQGTGTQLFKGVHGADVFRGG